MQKLKGLNRKPFMGEIACCELNNIYIQIKYIYKLKQ